MSIIVSLLFTSLFAYYFYENIRKKSSYYYIFACIIVCFNIYIFSANSFKLFPDFLRTIILLFTKASISSALFIIVMYIGILPPKSSLRKRFMPIRAELSIIASILTLGHNIIYGNRYFIALFTNKKIPENLYYASIVSLILIAIMLPLFITSFKTVRKKMKAKNWKKLQRTAYIFYFLLWLHVILIYTPIAYKGNVDALIRLSFYHIIYSIYIFGKLKKLLPTKNNTLLAASIASVVLITALSYTYLPIHKEEEKQVATTETSTTIKTEQITQTSTKNLENIKDKAKVETETTTTTEKTSETEEKNDIYQDGEYYGIAKGYVDDIEVKVVIENQKIAKVIIEDEQEDFEYMILAEDIVYDIVAANSTKVDTITGATTSSKAILKATEKALSQAK